MQQQEVTPENLKLIREYYKLTIQEMADRLGMSTRNYDRFEKGEFEVGERLRGFMAGRLDHFGFDLAEVSFMAQMAAPKAKPRRNIAMPIRAWWAKLSENWKIAIFTAIFSTFVTVIVLVITLKSQK